MGKKVNFEEAVQAGAEIKSPIDDRFTRAQALVAQQPTAFSSLKVVDHSSDNIKGGSSNSPYFVELDVSLLDENPFNARFIYRQERIEELAASMRANGQDTPVMVTPRNGRFTLAAGHYRRKAVIMNGTGKIKAMVHPDLDDHALYLMSHRENDERSEQTALDNAYCWSNVLKKGLYDSETSLAEAIKKSLPTVNKTLAILDLPEPVLAIIAELPEAFSLTALYELTQLAKATDDLTLLKQVAEKIREGEAGRAEVKAIRERISQQDNKQPRTRQGNSRQYKIEFDGAKAGFIKDFDHGKVVFEVNGLSPEDRAELVETLKTRFKVI